MKTEFINNQQLDLISTDNGWIEQSKEEWEREVGKITIECACGTHMLKIQRDNEDGVIYLAMYSYGNNSMTFWNRIKLCWQVLTKGSPYSDQIVLDKEEQGKLLDFITLKK